MTGINKTQLKQLLQKEALGTLLPAEQKQLDDWYNSFDESEKNTLVFRDEDHEKAVKARLLHRILESGSLDTDASIKTFKYRSIIYWASIAAIFLAIVGGLLFWNYSSKTANGKELMLSVETGNGMVKKVSLTDGTEIWLNAGSKLSYPSQFKRGKREVYLEGEAYFKVKHDPSWPFAVHTEHLTTNVLGTAFSVTAYKSCITELVSVISGKVAVANNLKLLGLLTSNKRIAYNISNNKSTISNTDAALSVSWMDGKLQFDDQDMHDIAGRLGRWYGYSFKFEHKNIGNCRYTASFNSKIPLNNLLRVMKAISLVNYKIDTTQRTVTFLGTGCNE